MARTQGISGTAVGIAAAGGLLIYAGVTDQSLPDALRSLVKGQATKPARWIVPLPSPGGPADPSGSASGFGAQIASQAQKYLRRPYVWGGTFEGPTGGGDCSGLVFRVMSDLGIRFPRVSSAQLTTRSVRSISRSDVTTGDFVGRIGAPGHIGIALDNTRGIFAPRRGTVVQIQPIDSVISRAVGIYVRYNGPGPSIKTARSARAE
jgi:cell wall-associated NlpC family hydrolase